MFIIAKISSRVFSMVISTSYGLTAAMIGIFSSLAIVFFSDTRNTDISALSSRPFAKPFEKPEFRSKWTLQPSCDGVSTIKSMSSLYNKIILIDTFPFSNQYEQANDLAQRLWEEKKECNVGFLDFSKYPKLAAMLGVTQIPQWMTIVDEQRLAYSTLHWLDCLLTLRWWNILVHSNNC